MSQGEICRICEGNEELEFIFNDENPSVAEKLMMCADVQVEYEDPLPKYICLKCQQNLDFVYLFRKQCEQTDRRLREIYTPIEHDLEIDLKPKELQTDGNSNDYLVVSDPKVEEEEYLLEEYEDVEELIEGEEEDSINESIGANTDEVILYDELEAPQLAQEYYNSGTENYIEESSAGLDKDENSETNETIAIKHELYSTSETLAVKNLVEESFNVSDNSDLINKSGVIVVEYDIDASSKENEIDESKLCIKTKTPPPEKFFCCDTCGESFGTFVEFNLHKKTHGDHRYQCPVCKKWFSKRYRLKNHMAVHEQSKSFCCEICGNKYTNQGNLDRHIRHFHKKERPYMCTECGLSFSRSNILKLHYTVHINERNYECEICNKR